MPVCCASVTAAGLAGRLHRHRLAVLLFWAAAALAALPFAPRLLQDTELTFTPPGDSQAARATRAFERLFPVQANLTNLVVLARTRDGADVRDKPALRDFCFALNASLHAERGFAAGGRVFDFQSYFTLTRLGAPPTLAEALLQQNPDGTPAAHPTSTLFVVVVRGEETSKGLIKFSEDLRDEMARLDADGALGRNGTTVTLTGLPALYDNIMASAIHDLETMDSLVLPIALSILALLVWSFRLLLVTLAALGVSAALSFATVDALTKAGVPILTAAPSLMASVFIAMSIDYSMFLLTRFQEEKLVLATVRDDGGRKKQTVRGARAAAAAAPFKLVYEGPHLSRRLRPVVAAVLASSGKIIVASGSTLVICFLGLLALPLNLMQSIGISCAVSLVYTMLVNLTLCPALLFTFPSFFTNSCLPQWWVRASDARLAVAMQQHAARVAAGAGDAAALENYAGAPPAVGDPLVMGSPSPVVKGVSMDANEVAGRLRSSSRLSGTGLTSGTGSDVASAASAAAAADASTTTTAALLPENTAELRKTCWFKVALFTQTWYGSLAVLAVVAAAMVPLGLNAFDGGLSATMDAYLPRGSEGRAALLEIAEDFSAGVAYPYRMTFEVGPTAPHGTSVLDKTFVEAVQSFLTNITDETDPRKGALPNGTQLESFLWATGSRDPGPAVPFFIIEAAMKGNLPAPLGPFIRRLVNKEFTNADRTAAVVELSLGVAPFSNAGRTWLKRFRARMREAWDDSTPLGLPMTLSGFGGDVADSLTGVYAAWPTMVLLVCGVVLLIIGGSFGSALIALRGVVTIGVTIVFVSGLAKLAYCDGIFAFLGDFAGFDGGGGGGGGGARAADQGMVWIVQPTIFPLMVGIALDYDIFLVGRIVELREAGMSTRDAILLGVASTGTIITAAGIIQALAFFGLMLSSILVLNQLSFFLFFAVLFDTFVVRTLVVPSIMFWLGEANWWPMRRKQEKRVLGGGGYSLMHQDDGGGGGGSTTLP